MNHKLKIGDTVTCARTTVKPARVRKNGEQVPEKIVTKLREGVIILEEAAGWVVEWRDSAHRCKRETYFSHEITKLGYNLLWAADK